MDIQTIRSMITSGAPLEKRKKILADEISLREKELQTLKHWDSILR